MERPRAANAMRAGIGHRRLPIPFASSVFVALLLAGVVSACGILGSESGLARFSGSAWSFAYPSDWTFEPISYDNSFYSPIGYLGSTPVDTARICETTSSSETCDPRGYDMPAGNVVIAIGGGSWIMTNPADYFEHPSEGTSVVVAGMPTIYRETRLAGDRVLLTWMIANPTVGMNWVQLDADIRGPAEAALRSQVEALIASFTYDAGPVPLPTAGLQ